MKTILKLWYSKYPFLFLLLPFSYIYQCVFFLNKLSYRLGIKKSFVSPVPVIVVGNLTVGGTGKTPFTIELAKQLAKKNFRPGIISRGYKGKAIFPQRVTEACDPEFVGDEPILIAAQTNCPVVVSPNRSESIKMLLTTTDCNIILSDDGLQHHALKRDMEIVIVDGERKFGNGFCIPAGPLRESIKKLSSVDFIIYNDGSNAHKYSMRLFAGEIYNMLDSNKKLLLEDPKVNVHAVAAIGHPERFFNSLRKMGYHIHAHVFPDHHLFHASDFDFCTPHDVVIMTEKDAVKCRKFARSNFWVLPVRSQICSIFIEEFFKKVNDLATRSERPFLA